MRIVKLWGGLGNQLFQYVFAHYIESLTNEKVYFVGEDAKLDLSSLKINRLNIRMNESGLEQLKICESYFKKYYRIKRKLIQILPNLKRNVLVEKDSTAFITQIPKAHIFDGYWQDLSYLENHQSTIREAFQFKNTGIFNESPYLKQIQQDTQAVALHLRRGDYLQSGYHYGLGIEYYKAAIEKICQLVEAPHFYVFTNDLDWTKEHLAIYPNMVFVDHSNFKDADLFDFHLMSQCKHNVIANSTFSWWAAWLNSNSDKQVVAPSQWYNGKSNILASKLLPSTWQII
jgi:hypothetical protein